LNKTREVRAPLGATLVVTSSVLYASYGVWTKLLGNAFGGYTVSAVRSILVMIILLIGAVRFRQLEPMQWKRDRSWLALLLLTACIIWGPLYYAIIKAGVGLSLSINYACIVIGSFLFGRLFLKERYNVQKFLATVAGFIGIALIFMRPGAHIVFVALCAAVISGLGSAANMTVTKRIEYNATQSAVISWCASIIANSVMAFVFDHRPHSIDHLDKWLYVVIFALASTAASWTFVKGSKMIEIGAAGILGLFEIVFGVLFGVAFFGERVGFAAAVGIVFIIAAAAIPYVDERRSKPAGKRLVG
jgi:drug/metabolite transporter (DMT)-like permease